MLKGQLANLVLLQTVCIYQLYKYGINQEAWHTGSDLALINSLRPGDALWQYSSGSTLAQVMACCLMAPNHCLNHVDLSWVGLIIFIWAKFHKGNRSHKSSRNYFKKHKINSNLQGVNGLSTNIMPVSGKKYPHVLSHQTQGMDNILVSAYWLIVARCLHMVSDILVSLELDNGLS